MSDLIEREEAKKLINDLAFMGYRDKRLILAALDALPLAGGEPSPETEPKPPMLLVGGWMAVNGIPRWWSRYCNEWRRLNGAWVASENIQPAWVDRVHSDPEALALYDADLNT